MIYELENEKLLVKVCSMGATLNSFIDKKSGTDIVLGFESEEEYKINNGLYLGAVVARCANRIDKGTYKINGVEYHAPINNGPNSLHGGEGISYKEFTLKEKTANKIVLERLLKDGEDGYPGNLKLTVTYELEDNELVLTFKGLSDKDTIMNVTNHSYFNMNGGKGDVRDECLEVYAERVALNDENGLASDKTINVKGTSFDFEKETLIGDNFKKKHPNLSRGGIDHNFLFENMKEKDLCTLKGDKLSVTISSDLPGVQIYTANYFNNEVGKYGIIYSQYKGVAIEPQFYPNAINYETYLKPLIKANEEVTHFIKYSLKEN